MGGMGGIEALQHIRAANPKQLVVLMTAFGTAQTAIEAMKYGAFDYVMKPFDPQKVLALADNAFKVHADLRAAGDYKPSINSEDYKEGIVGSSAGDAGGLQGHRPGDRQRRHGDDHRRKRLGQGARRPLDLEAQPSRQQAISSRSTARRFPTT
jgi:CheY-like chemotaxis protein